MTDPIGFDDIHFTILPDPNSGVYPDWDQEHDETVIRIPGSNTSVVQYFGASLATWTVRLEFADMATYRALKARQKTTGTLTLHANFTSAVGEVWTERGHDYESLDRVELVRLAPATIEIGHEWIEAEAIFRRPMNPLTGEAG